MLQTLVWRVTFFGVIACVLGTGIFADDFIVPPWRGDDRTTYQEWRFETGDNRAYPEVVDNTYGDPFAEITVGDFGEGWFDELPGFGSKRGFWDIGGNGGSIVLNIPNHPEPLPYKEMWVQVTYFLDITQAPFVQVPGGEYIGGETIVIEDVETGGYWMLDQSIWRLYPNPDFEQIVITSDPAWGAVIDQIVVDTICVPEPSMLTVLALGASALLIGLRRRA